MGRSVKGIIIFKMKKKKKKCVILCKVDRCFCLICFYVCRKYSYHINTSVNVFGIWHDKK